MSEIRCRYPRDCMCDECFNRSMSEYARVIDRSVKGMRDALEYSAMKLSAYDKRFLRAMKVKW